MTGTIRERSPGHFALRAYNAGTGKQVTKTYAHPPQEKGVGIAEAKKQLARPVSAIAEVRYWAKVDPAEQVTLSVLLDEGIAHGETCGLLAGGMTAASTRWRWRFSPPAEPEPNPKQR